MEHIFSIIHMFAGLVMLSFVTQPHWWRRCSCCKYRRDSSVSYTNQDPDTDRFLTDHDLGIIEEFKCYQNRPWNLFVLAMPACLSLLFCPLTLFLYTPLTRYFWPVEFYPDGPPNVNDVISCFLTPAGLVYAIAFGFAFQEAVGKQDGLTNRFAKQLNKMEHIMILNKNLPLLKSRAFISAFYSD